MNSTEKNDSDLFRIMSYSTALAFGTMVAFLYSLKDITKDATFVFSIGTVVVFAIGALAGWGFWKVVQIMADRKRMNPGAGADRRGGG